jgi:hypothetical protein
MKALTLVAILGIALVAVCLPLAPLSAAQIRRVPAQGVRPAGADKITGPYTYQNLAVFLIHGSDRLPGQKFLTLSEALKQRKVVVYETRSVNELAIENVSDEDVYVQSGDIVKGGQQDRMLGVDMIVPPHSGRISIEAFCVEHGRWTKRGAETATRFESSTERVATRELKLAANQTRSQTQVWQKVEEAQNKLSANVGTRVNSAASESSFQLALENRKVQETAANYVKALTHIADEQQDVIGYAFAINGQINSADVYASHALFRKLWPSLLKASAIEAIAELQRDRRFAPVTADNVADFLAHAEHGRQSDERNVTRNVQLVTRETDEHVMIETKDRSRRSTWLHRSYIKK